jgi:uncharacterized RDD family membrane protein YckC
VDVTGGVPSCPSCGETIPDPSSTSGSAATARFAIPRVIYAGFWRRAGAYVIDSFLLAIVIGFLVLRPLMARAGLPIDNPWALLTGDNRQVLAINLLLTMAGWLYWALLESSPWQATFGKRIFGLEVTDLEGRRISFARATGRHFAKNISLFALGIGFLMAGFTKRKQGLHDVIAGCLVVKKTWATSSKS